MSLWTEQGREDDAMKRVYDIGMGPYEPNCLEADGARQPERKEDRERAIATQPEALEPGQTAFESS